MEYGGLPFDPYEVLPATIFKKVLLHRLKAGGCVKGAALLDVRCANLQHECVPLDGPKAMHQLAEILCQCASAEAHSIVRHKGTKWFLPFFRGAISVRQWLIAATGAEIPFHHFVVQEYRDSNSVVGYAHCEMVVAAR
ncbi:hypothetical protein EJB05_08382 [Eragrostis curvula]|uniref:Uncharacterized protein n=1 Tax=Eragrostis curvula TaxID=38414 RepID=A0A5J9W216_9POAL|nr:hypothetical protein EJB05_08382 [Eragrostis curvula]